MKKLMFTVAAVATAGTLLAQTPVAVEDGAQAVIDQSIEKAPAAEAVEASSAGASAEELVEKKLAAQGLSSGYDSKRKAIIQIGSAVIKIKDPANDSGFMLAREQVANNAYMNAKADIIRAINTEFSAMDRAMIVAEFGEDETAKKFAEKQAEIEAKRGELVQLLSKADAAEAQSVGEVELGDRFKALLDGLVKRINTEYNPDALAASKAADAAVKKAQADEIRARCVALMDECKALEAEAAKMPKDPAMETASDVKALSKMPLLGASIITQAESWDPSDQVYMVAMAVVWSPRLQEDAIRILSGDFTARAKKGKYTKEEWAKAQNFGTMVGARRFTDSEGRNLFVGIAAADLKFIPVVKQNAAKKMADSMAMKAVAFSLAGDLETYREASQNLKVYEDDSKAALGKLSDAVSAKVTLNLNGCLNLVRNQFMNPIVGRKIYVSAYYIDPALAAEAQGYMKKLFADAGLADKITKRRMGVTVGAQAVLDAQRKSNTEFVKGVAEGATGAVPASTTHKKTTTKVEVETKVQTVPAPAPAKATSTGGAFSGDTIDDDF